MESFGNTEMHQILYTPQNYGSVVSEPQENTVPLGPE